MKTDNWEKITKAQYDAYIRVRDEGLRNMAVNLQEFFRAGLDKDTYWTIISHYSDLMKKFGSK